MPTAVRHDVDQLVGDDRLGCVRIQREDVGPVTIDEDRHQQPIVVERVDERKCPLRPRREIGGYVTHATERENREQLQANPNHAVMLLLILRRRAANREAPNANGRTSGELRSGERERAAGPRTRGARLR